MNRQPPEIQPGDSVVSKDTREKLNALLRQAFRPISGDGVSDLPHAVVIEHPENDGNGEIKFLAKITGSASLASASIAVGGGSSVTVIYRWKYAWTEVRRSGDGVVAVDGGRSGTTSADYAINLREIGNTSGGIVWGTDITGTNYPSLYRPKPIGGGGADTNQTHTADTVVEMTVREDATGNKVYDFCAMGSHDGTCV